MAKHKATTTGMSNVAKRYQAAKKGYMSAGKKYMSASKAYKKLYPGMKMGKMMKMKKMM